MSEEKEYAVLSVLIYNNERFEVGSTVMLDDATAAQLKISATIGDMPTVDEAGDEETPEAPSEETTETDVTTDEAGDEEKGFRYHAEHRGGGRWYVIDETTGESVGEPMNKIDAHAKADELNAEV